MVITASGSSAYPVGMCFTVRGSAAETRLNFLMWTRTLLQPPSRHLVGSDEDELRRAVELGLIHESLVEEPFPNSFPEQSIEHETQEAA